MSVDWAQRYRQGDTPWDLGRPHPELVLRLARDDLRVPAAPAPARALVPGCGRGHDALALAEAGYAVTAIDLVAELREPLAVRLTGAGGRFVLGDALAMTAEPFDLFFEHTFFAAIDPASRPAWGALVRRMLVSGGRLAAIAFPADRPGDEPGPPWRTSPEDLLQALGSGFRVLASEPAVCRVATRTWAELWLLLERSDQPEG